MSDSNDGILEEIRDKLNDLSDGQAELIEDVGQLKNDVSELWNSQPISTIMRLD
jgi:hypothetical protein